jgi:hypothetical protein
MAKIVQYSHVCDYCGKVLSGFEKGTLLRRDHIEFRGTILKQEWDKKTNRSVHFYATLPPAQDLAFCDTNCLADYIKLKGQKFREYAERQLEQGKRSVPGYEIIDATQEKERAFARYEGPGLDS